MSPAIQPKSKSGNALTRYLRETRAEIAKVTWPTREELIRLTWIVSLVTVISAIFLFGIDSVFSALIGALLRIG
ncbi:MAG: preprotein translocase subunit SecE [Caldilineaceae bacterium]|nr:preprotein translocase subunit SecE [Caldilineaceae bacterium]MCB9140305.1 preprotein translocase subunit SecE [Caldilineaceae bacterium]